MRSILYFLLLIAAFGSFNLFAAEQLQKEELHNQTSTDPSSISSDENIAKDDNLQENLQKPEVDHIEEKKPLEIQVDQPLNKEEKEDVLEIEDQVKEKAVKKTIDEVKKDRSRKKPVKSIAKKEEGKEEKKKEEDESKNLQKQTKLNRAEWQHKYVQNKLIHKREYNRLNEHLPTAIFMEDYSKQLFYCIKKNNLSCIRGVITKLEKLGLTTKEILKFKNKLGDTLLIYAVKQGQIDIVRFLLLQGAELKVVNYAFKAPIDIAIEKKQIDIINVITEMTPHLLEHKKIDNKKRSEMYNWALNEKKNNESQCDKKL
ncbi:MAG: hypothetical protein PG981_001091 [Wolbachia endosymbiont of Ctenocephalides orientis wCori]|nr:MAG: hypothetical protein PG981_001091 [Wolbachia endosymbiont of Ctenocephalides orientis wCori]